jgi:chemotaxis protein CheC
MGVNSSATALSQLLGANVSLVIPKIEVKRVEHAKEGIGDPEAMVAAVYSQIFGKNSSVLIMFPKKSALSLVSMLQKKARPAAQFSDMDKSAFDEMGNILVAAYLSAIANFLKTRIEQGIPNTAVDMAGSVVDAAIVQIATGTNEVIVTDAQFTVGKKIVGARIYFLFEPEVVDDLLRKAKKI